MRVNKVIMFDLGGVLIENRGREGLEAMLPEPLEAAEMWRKWLESPSVRQFERGQIPSEAFAAAFLEEWRISLGPEEFIGEFATWPTGLFPGAEELLLGLKGRHHLACLSNTNPIHWRRFPQLPALFDSCFLSHEMGLVKPDRETFEYALVQLGMPAQDVYFFDDLLPNVDAARELGMNAFQVADFSAIEPILRRERLYG